MFQKITEHIYLRSYDHYTDRPNIGLITGDKFSLLFEAGNSANHVSLLKKELSAASLPLPNFVAISHWHWDHSFGLHAWSCPTIAGTETNRYLRAMQNLWWDDSALKQRVDEGIEITFCAEMIKREYPDRTDIKVIPADMEFSDNLVIDLGGITCHLLHCKGPHASDSVICHIPEDHFLFLGDSNGKDLYGIPWEFDIAHEERLSETLAALPYDPGLLEAYRQFLIPLDFTCCAGGHAPPMSREELFASLNQ